MPMVRAMRLLNAIEAGTLTGTQLETLLTDDPGRLAELNVLMGMPGQVRRMAASSTAMTAVAASAKATAAVIASSTAVNAVFASAIGLQKMAANFAASATVRLAMWNSDTLLAGVQANNAALETMMAAGTAVLGSNIGPNSTIMAQGTKVILLRRWYPAGRTEELKWTRAGNNLPGYGSLAKQYGPAYEATDSYPTTDNATGNNVRACSGLYTGTGNLSVRYLPV